MSNDLAGTIRDHRLRMCEHNGTDQACSPCLRDRLLADGWTPPAPPAAPPTEGDPIAWLCQYDGSVHRRGIHHNGDTPLVAAAPVTEGGCGHPNHGGSDHDCTPFTEGDDREALADVIEAIRPLPILTGWTDGWLRLLAEGIIRAAGFRRAAAPVTEATTTVIDVAHIEHQRQWSTETFGPREKRGPLGPLAHIRKELAEVEEDPSVLEEWVDVLILAFDGAWRAGHEPQQIIDAIKAKQAKNEAREWPDWREYDETEAIEHVRPRYADTVTDWTEVDLNE